LSGVGDLGRWQRGARRYWEWKELMERLDEDRVTRVLTGMTHNVGIGEITGHDPAMADFHVQLRELYPEYNIGERFVSLESIEAILSYRPETVVDRISPRAAMWICSSSDTLVPPEESRSMYEKAGEPRKLVAIEGKRHHELYLDSGFERMMTYSTEWFDTYL